METIAIVDDDPYIVEVFCLTFERAGYSVLGFTDPVEALEAIPTKRVSLLILDLMMSPITGLQFLDERRKDRALSEIPVLILSAWDLSPEERKEYADDIAGIIRKPVMPRTLVEMAGGFLKTEQDGPVT